MGTFESWRQRKGAFSYVPTIRWELNTHCPYGQKKRPLYGKQYTPIEGLANYIFS